MSINSASLDTLPRVPGAYLLIFEFTHSRLVSIRDRHHVLDPGRYIYAGSARGPGGVRARIGRHGRRNKPDHWHVDQMRPALTAALAVPGGRECDLLEVVRGLPGASIPIGGFGSSDCRICPAHLVGIPRGVAPHALLGPDPRPAYLVHLD